MTATKWRDPRRQALFHLLVVGMAMLFWELAMIRWQSACIRVVGYYTNFVLIAAFFGLGTGALLARFQWPLRRLLLPALVACIAIGAWLGQVPHLNPGTEDVFTWFGHPSSLVLETGAASAGHSGIPLAALLGTIYLLTAAVFVIFGQWIGHLFQGLPPLKAYSVEIFGSVLGIIAFAALSFLELGPVFWFGVGFVLVLPLLATTPRQWALSGACCVLGVVIALPTASQYEWSPYYKICVEPLDTIYDSKKQETVEFPEPVGYALTVNNDYHQMMLDLRPKENEHPFLGDWRQLYDQPYKDAGSLPDGPILVVGAGTGNDVSAALRNTQRNVHAVDIDPAILRIGAAKHFEEPYANERVQVTVNDARSFFQNTDQRFALVVFGYLDSHTLLSSFSSLRLDNFVYTRQSLEQVRRILVPGGRVALTFATGEEWLHKRMIALLDEVFGTPTQWVQLDSQYVYGVVYCNGLGAEKRSLGAATGEAAAGGDAAEVLVPSDDWPFLYLRTAKIPSHYWLFIAIVVGLSFVPLATLPRGQRTIRVPYFLLGAGFFLVESSNIVNLSLMFGSTWIVNVMVFVGILVLVLLGNLTAAALPLRRSWIFTLLAANIAVAFLTPTASLLAIGDFGVRAIVAVAVFLGPVFFASLIFATLIRNERNLYQAYGSNILGAVVGGAAEYFSLVAGFKFLLLATMAIYALTYLLLRRDGRVPERDTVASDQDDDADDEAGGVVDAAEDRDALVTSV
ncbi:MAG: class I SAM-dependent methyltransferase [Planctomycetota bacterium]